MMLLFKFIKRVTFVPVIILCLPATLKAQKFLIPHTAQIQYAGSIGFVSAAVGYNLFHKHQGSLDLSYGYIPDDKGGDQNIVAAKFAYRPINIKIRDWAVLCPVNPGFFMSYAIGEEFDRRFSTREYPKGYYWWSTAIRMHLSLSTEIKLNAHKVMKHAPIKQLGVYSEFNTNDLYAVSWFPNRKEISFGEIFKLGIGMRAYF